MEIDVFFQGVDRNQVLRELSDETLLELIKSKMWAPSNKSRLWNLPLPLLPFSLEFLFSFSCRMLRTFPPTPYTKITPPLYLLPNNNHLAVESSLFMFISLPHNAALCIYLFYIPFNPSACCGTYPFTRICICCLEGSSSSLFTVALFVLLEEHIPVLYIEVGGVRYLAWLFCVSVVKYEAPWFRRTFWVQA